MRRLIKENVPNYKDVLSFLKHRYHFEYLACTMPVLYKRHVNGGTFVVNTRKTLYLPALVVSILYACVWTKKHYTKFYLSSGMDELYDVFFAVCLIATSISMFIPCRKQAEFLNLFETMNSIDNILYEQYSVYMDYGPEINYSWLSGVVCVTGATVHIFVFYFYVKRDLLMEVLNSVVYAYTLLQRHMGYHITNTVNMTLLKRLREVNRRIVDLNEFNDKKEIQRQLFYLAKLHFMLGQCATKVLRLQPVVILINIGCTLYSMGLAFFLYFYVDPGDTGDIIFFSCFNMGCFLMLIHLIEEVVNEKNGFLLQIWHNRIDRSAAGLFLLNRPLILTVFGTIMTIIMFLGAKVI